MIWVQAGDPASTHTHTQKDINSTKCVCNAETRDPADRIQQRREKENKTAGPGLIGGEVREALPDTSHLCVPLMLPHSVSNFAVTTL